jgi:hypothetical protein
VADPAGVGRGSGGGAGSSGLGSPVSERHATSGISNRKRNASLAGFDSSPGTVESPEAEGSEDGNHDDKRKQPVKRACNECRQQKVSHLAIGDKTKLLFSRFMARIFCPYADHEPSFAATSFKSPSSDAPAVSDFASSAKSRTTSSALEKGLATQRWRGR